jgi:arginase
MLTPSRVPLRPHSPEIRVAVVGIPLDHNSSHLRGARMGPDAIRAFLTSGSMNWTTECGVELEEDPRWGDTGDVAICGKSSDIKLIETEAAALWSRGYRVIALGGDHSITAPLLRAARAARDSITVVHFDAHPDLYPAFEGNPDSHASPFHRIMEERLVARLIQLGIRTVNAMQRCVIEKFGVEIVTPDEIDVWQGLETDSPVYVSIDMDVFDPAFAPAVSHYEPGGLSVREVLRALRRIRAPVIGGDIVELSPQGESNCRTAAVAAKLLKELLGKTLADLPGPASIPIP